MSTGSQVKIAPPTPQPAAAKPRLQGLAAPTVTGVEAPAVDAQQENAARLGHSFGAISVLPPDPPIQPKRAVGIAPRLPAFHAQLQRKPNPASVIPSGWAVLQRQRTPANEEASAEEETGEATPLQAKVADELQPKEQPGQTPTVTPDLEARLQSSQGKGQTLPPETRAFMEPRFGHDFGQVRVHADGEAAEMNRALQAQAFTYKQDLFFGAGKYNPEAGEGKRLLAHELTHVAQQNSSLPRKPMVQRQPATQTKAAKEASPKTTEEAAPGVVDLKGQSKFPTAAIDSYFTNRAIGKVRARYGSLAEGVLTLRKTAKGQYVTAENTRGRPEQQALPLKIHPLLGQLGLSLILTVDGDGQIKGFIGQANLRELSFAKLKEAPEKLGLPGFAFKGNTDLINQLADGKVNFGLENASITLGGAFSGKMSIAADDEKVTKFEGQATVNAKGLASGDMKLNYAPAKGVTGQANVGLTLPKQITGNVDVAWDGQAITGQGKVGYQGEKLSGEVNVQLMDAQKAKALEEQQKPPEKAASAKRGGQPGKVDYAVFGEGDLNFAFTDWLNGTAHVILDPEGHVTIIGKITPQKEFELFPQKDYNKPLFKAEARASYGIPVVGNIFIFANIGMDAFAKLGPARFYKIVVEGTYSTDPKKCKDFSISGSLNISAAAGLRLRGEAGAGLEILAHDIKAGAGINALAGIRGYAEATPTVGYREQPAAKGEDKKGEFFIRGDLEIAGQPFLGLNGDLFVEVDAPWWSPVPDKKWTWPLGGKEWPIGGSFGLKASVDYVFGAKQWPAIEFQPVDFSADKFLTDLYSDKAQPKSGEKEQKGAWGDKNSKEAAPPPKEGKQGSATPGKAPALPAAKPTVQPGGSKGATKPADPKARTAEGKSVKELQEEATKQGKKPAGKEIAKGAGKEEPTEKGKKVDKTKPKEEAAAKQMVKSALDTHLPKGARQLADVNKILTDVAPTIKPTLTALHTEEVMPGKPKNEGAIGFKVKAKGEKGGDVLITSVRYSQAGAILSHEERWKKGVEGVKKAVANLVKREISDATIKAQFPKWESEFGFNALLLKTDEIPWVIEGEMSPGRRITTISPSGTSKPAKGPNQKKLGILESPEITNRNGTLERDQDAITANLGAIPNHAAHHLIAISIAKKTVVMKAAAESGYDINRRENGEMLPRDQVTAKAVKKPMHTGGHLSLYFDAVSDLLQALETEVRKSKDAGDPWTESKLMKAVKRLEDRLRRRLLDPNDPLKLQKDDPFK